MNTPKIQSLAQDLRKLTLKVSWRRGAKHGQSAEPIKIAKTDLQRLASAH